MLYDIPDYLKTQKVCDDVARSKPYSIPFAPGWFVTEEQIDVWYYGDEYCNDDNLLNGGIIIMNESFNNQK